MRITLAQSARPACLIGVNSFVTHQLIEGAIIGRPPLLHVLPKSARNVRTADIRALIQYFITKC